MKHAELKPLTLALLCAGPLLLAGAPVQASSERAQLEALRATTQAILEALVERGILSDDAAKGLVRDAEAKGAAQAAAVAAAQAGVVRVQYVPEAVKREIREQIRQEVVAQAKTERWGEVNAVPEWVDRLKWEGDLRVRQQSEFFADGNAAPAFFQASGVNLNNTSEDRDRMRVRARLGLTAMATHNITGGLRITTGNTSDPVSTNQTLGTGANRYSLVLDRAFIRYQPLDWMNVSGGRLPNPFFSSDLVWDDDLNFEGLAASFKFDNQFPETRLKPFGALGLFPLQEIEQSPTVKAEDKWLLGAQIGTDWQPQLNTRWRFGLAYYDYRNIAGVRNPPPLNTTLYNLTAPQSRQKGNSLYNIDNDGNPTTNLWALAGKYQLANLTAAVDLSHYDPVHVVLNADVVKNLGYDRSEMQTRMGAGYKARTLGWQTRVTVGWPVFKQPYNWRVFAGYRYLERDAVLDAFTDSDFRLGGTDHKGYFIGGSLALDKNAWVSGKWMSADEIDGLPFSVDVLQLDFNARF